jgi:predicted alpha/beta-hydrolase family hydrolase
MRKGLRITLLFLGLLVMAASGFVLWGSNPLPAMPEAQSALISDAHVTVSTDRWLAFWPTDVSPSTGLIIYPGGHVEAHAYAPAARLIATQGFLVVIVPMPLSLAVLDAGAAADVIAAYPQIQHWAVGGHSLGGAMAANFAKSHPGAVDGLVLWASYPASSDNLSASALRVVSISASLDGLATRPKIDASRALLPADTSWVVIQGGNHAQFSWYGDQPGDNAAAISRQDQQVQIVQATVALLESIK